MESFVTLAAPIPLTLGKLPRAPLSSTTMSHNLLHPEPTSAFSWKQAVRMWLVGSEHMLILGIGSLPSNYSGSNLVGNG